MQRTMSGAMNVRYLPWLVALIGLAIPLIGGSFDGWQFVLVWLVALALIFTFSRSIVATAWQQIIAALLVLPFLVVLGWVRGWWLIPADLTWLALEVRQLHADRPATAGQ